LKICSNKKNYTDVNNFAKCVELFIWINLKTNYNIYIFELNKWLKFRCFLLLKFIRQPSDYI
jgi:hypothetical protein